MIARATDSRIIHKPMDLNQVVEANGPGWTGSLTPARYAYFFGRYVTFQLAEVAVQRELFRKILSLIDDLRPRPAPA